MPLNRDLRGKVYDPVEYTVDPERVRRFADAIGEDAPAFRDDDSARGGGSDGQLAPPTFVAVMNIAVSGQAVQDPDLGLDYSRVVHGTMEYEWERPARAGETLVAVPRIADVYARGPHEYLVIEAEVRDEAGAMVVRSRSTLISRGTAAGE
jgi:acyl dehydratase